MSNLSYEWVERYIRNECFYVVLFNHKNIDKHFIAKIWYVYYYYLKIYVSDHKNIRHSISFSNNK